MFIVNIQDVQISNVPDPKNPQQQISTLGYLNRQYTLVQVFPPDRLEPAQGLWRYLDEQSKVALIVKSSREYSVWVEKVKESTTTEQIDARLEPIFRTQLCFIDGLWAEVGELLGANQATTFGTEMLVSIPTIKSIKDLLAAIAIALQPDKSIEAYMLAPRQISVLQQEIQRLGGKYLGKNYTKELLGDLQQELSPQLKQEFQVWLKQQGG
jgi:hypothetical protein